MALTQNDNLYSLSGIFSNPEDSPFCARCMLGASSKGIAHGQESAGYKVFWTNFTQDLDFWKAQMRFLFAVRTEEQTRQMLERLKRCSCRMRDPGVLTYHQIGRAVENDIFNGPRVDAQTASVALVISLLKNLSSALQVAHVKSVAKRTATKWPTCPEDLMPFGPDNLIESFIVWSRIIPDNIVFAVATQCITLCGALLVPSVINSMFTRHAIDAGRRLFDRTWETIRLRAESTRRAMGETFKLQIRSLLKYFYDFYHPLPLQHQAAVLDGYEVKAVQVFSLLAYVADDPRLCLEHPEDYRTELSERGMAIYSGMKLYVDPLPSLRLHPAFRRVYYKEYFTDSDDEDSDVDHEAELNMHPDKDPADLFAKHVYGPRDISPSDETYYFSIIARQVIEHIRKARSDLYCSARDCPNSIQSTGREFRRCIGCNVALYCSKKCQSDAWNSDQYPHKVICKVLQRVIDEAGSKLLFSHLECEHVGFPQDLELDVLDYWMEGDVTLADLLKIAGWSSYRRYPASRFSKTECLPGYDDYDARIKELSARAKAIKARYVIIEKPRSDQEIEALRAVFDKSPDPIADPIDEMADRFARMLMSELEKGDREEEDEEYEEEYEEEYDEEYEEEDEDEDEEKKE